MFTRACVLVFVFGWAYRPTEAGAEPRGLAAAIANDLFVERVGEALKYNAVEHVLSEKPELREFQVSQFSWSVDNPSDLMSTSVAPFLIVPADGEASILLIITDDGWVNQVGLNLEQIQFEFIDRDTWGGILEKYLSARGLVELTTHTQIPAFHKNPREKLREQYMSRKGRVLEVGDTSWVEADSFDMGAIHDVSASGLEFYDANEQRMWFPFKSMDPATYQVVEVADDLRLVFHEESLGLFFIGPQKMVQMGLGDIKEFSRALMNKSFEEQ